MNFFLSLENTLFYFIFKNETFIDEKNFLQKKNHTQHWKNIWKCLFMIFLGNNIIYIKMNSKNKRVCDSQQNNVSLIGFSFLFYHILCEISKANFGKLN